MKDLFDNNGDFNTWENFAQKFNLGQNYLFKWCQIKSSIPKQWVKIIRDSGGSNLYYLKPHLMSKNGLFALRK